MYSANKDGVAFFIGGEINFVGKFGVAFFVGGEINFVGKFGEIH